MLSALGPHAILIGFWVVMIGLASFFLRMACSLCRTDMPSWKRSLISVFLVSFLAYVTFDYTCYLIMRSMDGFLLHVAPWYSYSYWFREPFGLKWFIVSHAGPLICLPFLFALFVAGVMQLVVLQAEVHFYMGVLIFLLQWAATILAGYLVSLVLGVGLDAMGRPPAGGPVAGAPDQGGKQGETTSPKMMEDVKGAVQGSREYMENAGKNLKTYADSFLTDFKEQAAPVTKQLPEPVQNFLDKGGWWAVLGVLVFIVLIWFRWLVRKLRGTQCKPKKKGKKRRTRTTTFTLKEDLNWIGAGFTEEGPHRILVKGLPAHLRIMVLAPGSRDAGLLSEEMADRVLDWIKPGLAEVVSYDSPGVRLWPSFLSSDGFIRCFTANLPIPEPKGKKSHWVLVAGEVRISRSIVRVGLALYVDQTNNLRFLDVRGERWLDVLGVKMGRPAKASR